DGYRPHEPVRQPRPLDDARPVGLAHEAFEGAEAADHDHLEIGEGALVEDEGREARCLLLPARPLGGSGFTVDEHAAVRGNRILACVVRHRTNLETEAPTCKGQWAVSVRPMSGQ